MCARFFLMTRGRETRIMSERRILDMAQWAGSTPSGQVVVSSHTMGWGPGGAGGSGGLGGLGGGLGLSFVGKLACMATPHWPCGAFDRPRTSLHRQSKLNTGLVPSIYYKFCHRL